MIDGQSETIDFLFNRQGKSMEKGVVELLVVHGVNGWAFPYFSDLFLVEGVGKLWGKAVERKLHVPIRKHAKVSLHVGDQRKFGWGLSQSGVCGTQIRHCMPMALPNSKVGESLSVGIAMWMVFWVWGK